MRSCENSDVRESCIEQISPVTAIWNTFINYEVQNYALSFVLEAFSDMNVLAVHSSFWLKSSDSVSVFGAVHAYMH